MSTSGAVRGQALAFDAKVARRTRTVVRKIILFVVGKKFFWNVEVKVFGGSDTGNFRL
jgi:hypothetical protein